MERLKGILEQYKDWENLRIYVVRIELFLETDFGMCVENVKSLLESIAKEICSQRKKEYEDTDNLGKLLKYALQILDLNDGDATNQITRAIANIGQQLGNLRNEVGITSHGRPLEQLTKSRDAIDKVSLTFLLGSAELVACFLIELFETQRLHIHDDSTPILLLTDNEDFNEYWDGIYGDIIMGAYSYSASEVLFYVDPEVYKNELTIYNEMKHDTNK